MSEDYTGYTNSLINYIMLIKKETKLDISLWLEGGSLIDYYNNPKLPCKFMMHNNRRKWSVKLVLLTNALITN